MPQLIIIRRRLLLVFPLAAALIGLSAYALTREYTPEPLPASAPAVSTAKYAARIVEGRVAIYRAGARYPMEITDIEAASLPRADQEALEAGIDLADEEAIAHLLEDYS